MAFRLLFRRFSQCTFGYILGDSIRTIDELLCLVYYIYNVFYL